MVNKGPTPQEVGRDEIQAQAAKSLEALTATPLEFTGDFEEDYEIAWEWKERLDRAFVDTPLAENEAVYKKAVKFLEKQICWKHRLTTDRGSRYFISESGVVIRAKTAQEIAGLRILPPSRLLGFAPPKFITAFEKFFYAFQDSISRNWSRKDYRYHHHDKFINCSYVHNKEEKDRTRITFFRFRQEPRRGWHPIDIRHTRFCEKVEVDPRDGAVTLTYAPDNFPAIHPGNKIKKIDR
jgi:hypothetical protein